MKVQVKVNNMNRMKTKEIQIGDRVIGGENPILIQSMCNTRTEDVKATVEQILHPCGGSYHGGCGKSETD